MEVIINEADSSEELVVRLSEAFRQATFDSDPIYIPALLYYLPHNEIKETKFATLSEMVELCRRVFDIAPGLYSQAAVSFQTIPFCGYAIIYLNDGKIIEMPELLAQEAVGTA